MERKNNKNAPLERISHSFEAIFNSQTFDIFLKTRLFDWPLYKNDCTKIFLGVKLIILFCNKVFFLQKALTQKTFSYLFPYLRINILLKFFVYLLSSAFFWNNFLFVKGPQAKWFFSLRCLSIESIEWVGTQWGEIIFVV